MGMYVFCEKMVHMGVSVCAWRLSIVINKFMSLRDDGGVIEINALI